MILKSTVTQYFLLDIVIVIKLLFETVAMLCLLQSMFC